MLYCLTTMYFCNMLADNNMEVLYGSSAQTLDTNSHFERDRDYLVVLYEITKLSGNYGP